MKRAAAVFYGIPIRERLVDDEFVEPHKELVEFRFDVRGVVKGDIEQWVRVRSNRNRQGTTDSCGSSSFRLHTRYKVFAHEAQGHLWSGLSMCSFTKFIPVDGQMKGRAPDPPSEQLEPGSRALEAEGEPLASREGDRPDDGFKGWPAFVVTLLVIVTGSGWLFVRTRKRPAE